MTVFVTFGVLITILYFCWAVEEVFIAKRQTEITIIDLVYDIAVSVSVGALADYNMGVAKVIFAIFCIWLLIFLFALKKNEDRQ